MGRTGTFIAIDAALKQVQKEGVVDIYNTIEKLRYQRPHMVQTLVCAKPIYFVATTICLQEQYMFIHDAILESITCGNTQINVMNLQKVVNKLKQRDQTTSLTGFEQQLKVMEYNLLITVERSVVRPVICCYVCICINEMAGKTLLHCILIIISMSIILFRVIVAT